jgi:hypothetical protein
VARREADSARTELCAAPTKMLGGRGDNEKFDDEARKLFARLGLSADGGGSSSSGAGKGVRGLYNPLDAMWRDQTTGGTIFVGNQQAAQNANLLQQHGITHVVNCTDTMPFYHQNVFTYYRFNISFWPSFGDVDELQRFLTPLWAFVDGVLAKGESVLVHCLAGAHRAGTTGILCLMCGSQSRSATSGLSPCSLALKPPAVTKPEVAGSTPASTGTTRACHPLKRSPPPSGSGPS